VASKRIIELAEGLSLKKSAKEAMKDFLSAREDSFRNPYARYFDSYSRPCIFINTTNEIEYLVDTENRRWLIVEARKEHVKDVTAILDPDSQIDFDLAWGEAMHIWQAAKEMMGDNFLMKWANALSEEAKKHADMHREYDPVQGLIEKYLDDEVDRYEASFDPRLQKHTQKRPRVCIKEIMDWLTIKYQKRYEKRDMVDILDAYRHGWIRNPKRQKCGEYGLQTCWEYYSDYTQPSSDPGTQLHV
jgi:predicted P-loop ATPase